MFLLLLIMGMLIGNVFRTGGDVVAVGELIGDDVSVVDEREAV